MKIESDIQKTYFRQYTKEKHVDSDKKKLSQPSKGQVKLAEVRKQIEKKREEKELRGMIGELL